MGRVSVLLDHSIKWWKVICQLDKRPPGKKLAGCVEQAKSKTAIDVKFKLLGETCG